MQLQGTEFIINPFLLFNKKSVIFHNVPHNKDSNSYSQMGPMVTAKTTNCNDEDEIASLRSTDSNRSSRSIAKYQKRLQKYVNTYRNSLRSIQISVIGTYGRISITSTNNTINIIQYPVINKNATSVSLIISLNKKYRAKFNNLLDCPVITILMILFNNIEKQAYHGQLFVAVNGEATFLGNINRDKLNEFSISGIVDVINFDIKEACDLETKTRRMDWKSYTVGTLSIMVIILAMFMILIIRVFKQIKIIKQNIGAEGF
jgi:hypothetical protein